MPTTETITSTFADLPYSASLYSYECGGTFHKIARVERKRVYAVVHWVGGSTETVRLDEPRQFQREVPTEQEIEARRVDSRLENIKRFVETRKSSYDTACQLVSEKRTSGAHTMTSFDLDALLEATAYGAVAVRIEYAVLLPEDMSDAQRVERAQDMCSEVVTGFWGSQSTSNASNQLEWHTMAAWGDFARSIARGW